jgi:hypothetical protein
MNKHSIALLVYGDERSPRNALTEEKYSKLAGALTGNGFEVNSVMYNDAIAAELLKELSGYDAVLVWVNPIEEGGDRKKLDVLLTELSKHDCYVSAHPEVILAMGTKDVLYKTKEAAFGSSTKLYSSFAEFKEGFFSDGPGTKVLKQYRGNGGKGVFKIDVAGENEERITITNAWGDDSQRTLDKEMFFGEFKPYFNDEGILIEQPWKPGIINGMVRCYLSGKKVAGFGYQEVNALYPKKENETIARKPGKRYYFSEDCGLFQDLREIMENKWIQQLQNITGVKDSILPLIWDADFFINKVNTELPAEKYTLCEINTSCVSPFPESAIPYMVEMIRGKCLKDG